MNVPSRTKDGFNQLNCCETEKSRKSSHSSWTQFNSFYSTFKQRLVLTDCINLVFCNQGLCVRWRSALKVTLRQPWHQAGYSVGACQKLPPLAHTGTEEGAAAQGSSSHSCTQWLMVTAGRGLEEGGAGGGRREMRAGSQAVCVCVCLWLRIGTLRFVASGQRGFKMCWFRKKLGRFKTQSSTFERSADSKKPKKLC